MERHAHVGDEPAAHDKDRLLAHKAKRIERVHDLEHRVHRFVQLAALNNLERRREAVRGEVGADLGAVQPVHGLVEHDEHAAPLGVELRELAVLRPEDAVEDLEAVIDFFDAL